MAQLVYLKENIKQYYQKYSEYIVPAMKLIFSFVALCLIQNIFSYNSRVDKPLFFLLVSVAQAFLPMSFLFYSASALILLNLWKVSVELAAVYALLILIFFLFFIRVDGKYAFIIILTPILFYLKLEYFLPVLLGMLVGFGGILPMVSGILVYFLSVYTEDASALLTTTVNSEPGIGISRVVSLAVMDGKFFVLLVTFSLVMLISTILYQMFHEKAWMFSIIIGNVSLAFLLLAGRLIFGLDYAIWRIFLETVAAVALAVVVQFFKGIGDFSRIEKVSFEDDEYIYFVKAVPKIKAAQAEHNVTDILPETDPLEEMDLEEMPLEETEKETEEVEEKKTQTEELQTEKHQESAD